MSENLLDRYLPEAIRTQIEQAYYARINQQGQFEQLVQDPEFWQDPTRHAALFADHGVVHVRDVAWQILQVLKTINGVLIPPRHPNRMECFMYGYGVMLAYLHDIGMADLTEFGRAMHPEFAAQAVFTADLDDLIEKMWAENCGEVPGYLIRLANEDVLMRDPQIVFREILALSIGHSKTKVPIAVLDDPVALRSQLQFVLSHTLPDLYCRQQAAKGRTVETASLDEPPPQFLSRFYADFEKEAFDWLVAGSVEAHNLVSDITDTLRALRCADALRQRGTVQKTSGGYEVFVNQQTGNAIFALRLGNEKLYLLEMPDKLSVGEANIASSELTQGGDLRISFHRGAYANDQALHRSVGYTAFTINDMLGDIVDSFCRGMITPAGPLKSSGQVQILLESTDDNPRFTEMVQEQLRQLNPVHADQVQIVPSLQNVSELERAHYLAARELDWDMEKRRSVLECIAQSGHKIAGIPLVDGFKHVKLIELRAGETLIEAGAPSAFVYLPLGDGLKIIPLGGYQSFCVAAWMPIGNTGVIRGAARNAGVVTDQDVSLLMIPKDVYMRHWYAPYTYEELKALLAKDG